MIQARPKGWLSSDYLIEGENLSGEVSFSWKGEEGSIVVNGVPYAVDKPSLLTGRWHLLRDGVEVATARKPSMWRSKIEIESSMGLLALRTVSFWSSSYVVERDGVQVAALWGEGLWGRRISIDARLEQWDPEILIFAFWLLAMLRNRDNSAGAA